MIHKTSSVSETRRFGGIIASDAETGHVYALEGDLGTGKTEFVRGFVAMLDSSAIVRSPSFSIVNTYASRRFPVYHFDFYRLCDESELVEIGFEEYLNSDGVCLIEWATMFPSVLPPQTRLLTFRDTGRDDREIRFDFPLKNRTLST